MKTINPKDVVVTQRARKHVGWLDSLERSISKHGMLQPIGITPDNVLVFGERRLRACINLGIEEIHCRVVDVNPDDPAPYLKMERDENNERRDFTPEEKVEIARRIEVALAGRHGKNQHTKEDVQNFADAPQGNSRDLAAETVGWSGETYRKAKTVFNEADEETREAVNKGEKSIHKAYTETKAKKKPDKRIWRLSIDLDSQESMNKLADTIIDEVEQSIAIGVAERILSRYGKLEVTK